MKFIKIPLLLIFVFLTITLCLGQVAHEFIPFESEDYPPEKYLIRLDTTTFYAIKIEIIQAKLKSKITNSETDFYCRAWLTITQGNKIITRQFFNSIEPVGGAYGIYIPDQQPRKDYFIFSKFGDYDGRIFILDYTGVLTEAHGGSFYISKDKQYLFSNYDSDISGLTVFDLNKRVLIYSESDDIPYSIGDWYFQNEKFYASIYNEDSGDDDDSDHHSQKIKMASFDINTRKLEISSFDKSFLKKGNYLNFYQFAKNCSCGK